MRLPNSSLKSGSGLTKKLSRSSCRYYDQMDDEIKELIPLKKIWVVNNDDE